MTWTVLNLAHLDERPAIQPTLGAIGLVYPGKRHVFSGPQESAKTLAAYAIALAEIRQGGTVVLIDLEMGQWDARDRLRELGATVEDFDRLQYIEPETPATEEIIGELVDLAPTLVIIDAAAGAYDLQGLDDNKRSDVEKFAGIYVRAFWLREIATILIDHVVKNADNRGKYAIGSERKIGSADVHLGFEAITSLVRGGSGFYKITTHKDRGGWLPRPRAAELELRSDQDTHAITWAFKAPTESAEVGGGEFRPTVLMERVSRYLEDKEGAVSRRDVERDVTGKGSWLRKAIDCLVTDEYARESDGPHGARLVESIQPFRDGELVPLSSLNPAESLVPKLVPDEPLNQADLATSSHVVPSSSLVPEPSSSLSALSPTGGADRRDEVGIGHEFYPLLLAESVRDGHITHAEARKCLTIHELVERDRGAP